MKFILPFVIAAIIAGALSGKVHSVFSSNVAAALDILIYLVVFFITYKAFRYLRDL